MKNIILILTTHFLVVGLFGQAPFSRTVHGFAPQSLIHNCIARTQHSSPNFYAVASTVLKSGGNNDIVLTKLDITGTVLWSIRIDFGADDRALDVIIDNNDDILVTGYVGDPNNHELYVAKYDQFGGFVNDFQLNIPYTAGTTIIESIYTGEYYIGGYEGSAAQSFNMPSKGLLLKLDPGLNTLFWTNTFYQSNDNNTITDIVELNNSNLFITGSVGHDAPGQVVLAAIIDFSLGTIVPNGNLSFAPGNDHSLGASLAYDDVADEVWLLFNSEIKSKPYVIGFDGVTSPTPSINPSGFIIDAPGTNQDNYTGYSLLLSPSYTDGLTVFGYKDATSIVPSGFGMWGIDMNRYTGNANTQLLTWNSNGTAPSPGNIEYQGGGVLSLFSPIRTSPYFHTPTMAIESVYGNRFVSLNLDDGNTGFPEYNVLSFNNDLALASSNCFFGIDGKPSVFNPNPEQLFENTIFPNFVTPNLTDNTYTANQPPYCVISSITSGSSESNVTNVEEKELEKSNRMVRLSAYPNPTNNFVNLRVEGGTSIKHISIMNNLGQVVYSNTPPNSIINERVDMSQFSKGLYIVKVLDSDNSVLTQRVIKH